MPERNVPPFARSAEFDPSNTVLRYSSMPMVHEVARRGFSDPADYEAARPSYPADAVAWIVEQLGMEPGRRFCDVAAGTGKLTRLLRPTGASLLAVEPVAGMRATFLDAVDDVPVVAATAEALPFGRTSFDGVTVAQAWHWFDHDRAATEMRRILRAGGGLALVWNARDRSVEWVDDVWGIVDRVEKRAPWRNHDHWRDTARDLRGFSPPALAEFRHAQEMTGEQVVRRIASVSHVAVLPDTAREAVLREVRAVVGGTDRLTITYRVDCVCMFRH